jgi:hypothetical protein
VKGDFMMDINRGDLYSPVVKALKSNGGSASIEEINKKVKGDLPPLKRELTEGDLFALHVISVIEDLERNGMIERIDEDLFTLSY